MNNVNEFLTLMKKEELHPLVRQSFAKYYEQIAKGATGLLGEQDIQPPQASNLVEYENLENQDSAYWKKLAVIKLNGGLGTSMGLTKAKSLLRVKEEHTFLDIISLQILALRKAENESIPLLFMNSFNTREDTLSYLEKYPSLAIDAIPLDFVQNKFPKIKQKDLSLLKSEAETQNWNPPGHGEIYLTMHITGILEQLLKAGYEYAFISNSDNLGALADPKILTLFAEQNIPFLMEVCRRTEMDKKGGHLAQTKEGQLLLREVAQCPDEEIDSFQDIAKYSYFNTNNIWINLIALKKILAENQGFMPLPLILNKKKVEDTPVYQVESAMGAAIATFEGSKAIVVPRSRFLPVKKTNDLLALWSDAFTLHPDFSISLVENRNSIPFIELDEHFHNISLLEAHFAEGIPSLKNCDSLIVKGDVYFGKEIVCEGKVEIAAKETAKISNIILKNQNLPL
jgi:UTP--glucose-1-phosphate uridylyltransferase